MYELILNDSITTLTNVTCKFQSKIFKEKKKQIDLLTVDSKNDCSRFFF